MKIPTVCLKFVVNFKSNKIAVKLTICRPNCIQYLWPEFFKFDVVMFKT